jgi:hypothetical protein
MILDDEMVRSIPPIYLLDLWKMVRTWLINMRGGSLGSIAKEFFSWNHKLESACSLLENSRLRICKILTLIGVNKCFSPRNMWHHALFTACSAIGAFSSRYLYAFCIIIARVIHKLFRAHAFTHTQNCALRWRWANRRRWAACSRRRTWLCVSFLAYFLYFYPYILCDVKCTIFAIFVRQYWNLVLKTMISHTVNWTFSLTCAITFDKEVHMFNLFIYVSNLLFIHFLFCTLSGCTYSTVLNIFFTLHK